MLISRRGSLGLGRGSRLFCGGAPQRSRSASGPQTACCPPRRGFLGAPRLSASGLPGFESAFRQGRTDLLTGAPGGHVPDARDPQSETPGSQSRPRRESPGTLCREPALRPRPRGVRLTGSLSGDPQSQQQHATCCAGYDPQGDRTPTTPRRERPRGARPRPAAVGPEVGPAGASSGLFRDL